jgi:hypothetical protein
MSETRGLMQMALTLAVLRDVEAEIVKRRREVEDALLSGLGVDDTSEGTQTFDLDGVKVKVVGRMNRKVDADLLQAMARENGLTDHLTSLFRWKPELSVAAWKAAAPDITAPLTAAITTTPGRPSVSVESKED